MYLDHFLHNVEDDFSHSYTHFNNLLPNSVPVQNETCLFCNQYLRGSNEVMLKDSVCVTLKVHFQGRPLTMGFIYCFNERIFVIEISKKKTSDKCKLQFI